MFNFKFSGNSTFSIDQRDKRRSLRPVAGLTLVSIALTLSFSACQSTAPTLQKPTVQASAQPVNGEIAPLPKGPRPQPEASVSASAPALSIGMPQISFGGTSGSGPDLAPPSFGPGSGGFPGGALPTSDISVVEKTTLNGKVYDANHMPVDGAKITARSLNSSVPFEATATTAGGSYAFNNAPSGITIEITVTAPGAAPRTRTEVLKSNKTGDPNANRYDFGTDGSTTSFGTDFNGISDLPEIVSFFPGRNADKIDPHTDFVLTFSTPMDHDSVQSNILLKKQLETGELANAYDISAFDISWNSSDTEIHLKFKAGFQLDAHTDYHFTFKPDAVIKDKTGIGRSNGFFKLTDGGFESDVKFGILSLMALGADYEAQQLEPVPTPIPTPMPTPTPSPPPHAGLLTAGTWRDLDHWDYWLSLTPQAEYSQILASWGISPVERVSVKVMAGDKPAIDQPLVIKDASGKLMGEARTDNQGNADFFPTLFKPWQGDYRVETADGSVFAANLKADGKPHLIQLEQAPPAPTDIDVMLMLDTTSSMGDELDYLKVELADVLERVRKNSVQLHLRASANFYRDHGDEYLVRDFPFTEDFGEIQKELSAQSAAGGADIPEAVPDALENGLTQHSWSANARARLMFLVLDAPPHSEASEITRVQAMIPVARRLGVRIIPVASSGIDKSTEFLLRSLAIATGGEYVFLTDQSGVGNAHVEPTSGEYHPEKLNDLLVKLVQKYTY